MPSAARTITAQDVTELMKERQRLRLRLARIDATLEQAGAAKGRRRRRRMFAARQLVQVVSATSPDPRLCGRTGVVDGATWHRGTYYYNVDFPDLHECWQLAERDLKAFGGRAVAAERAAPLIQRVRVNARGEGYLAGDSR